MGKAIDEWLAERCAKEPANIDESTELSRKIEELVAKRDREKCEVYKRAAAEENEIRARRDWQLDGIDSRYETEISKLRQRLKDLLVDEPEASTAPRSLAPRPTTPGEGGNAQSSIGFSQETYLEGASDLYGSAEPTERCEGTFDEEFQALFRYPQSGSELDEQVPEDE